MRQVEKGKLVTVDQIRGRLAKDCRADLTCPLTTGIFMRIAAEAAEEDLREGKTDITPYWRVVKASGSLNDKFPGGVAAQAAHLRKEGYTTTRRQPASGQRSFQSGSGRVPISQQAGGTP
jgi:alkylated DNA nucleotide flippase Atl1